jgi:hydrophobe/amphiphile efflux-1 (HAE1) family protein/NodT family efflux transporter outer membrane factor (OMF) lipoprotein
MRFSHFFIDRPIFAAVISILIVILGALAYRTLPVTQYPDVIPPTIVVRALYSGAPPEVIAETVATPIEQEVNGVEDMLYMSSQSTADGQMTLTITFRVGTDLDKAQVLVQNRVAIAEPRLPEEVRRVGVTTTKTTPDLLMVVHLLSPDQRYDELYVSNFALLQLRDALARVDGVGDVHLFGLREYSMRVWLDPERMVSRSLTPGDVVAALREQNVQVASGVINQPPSAGEGAFQLPVTTLGRLLEPEQFANVIVKTGRDGRITRLRDVARIELGARDYAMNSYLDNQPAVGIAILQRPGSNAVATAEAVEGTMEELARGFPQGIAYRIVYNPTVFVRESITAVTHTLFEAVGLVVLVVLVFLQTWRASLIPLLAIPVSIVGTFAAMAAFGFSLNMLSLFGLVLAIGIVVDDAIVVVENVERHIRGGLGPRDAARKAMEEVTGAVIAIAFGLSAVFVPTAFLGGIAGQFYRQFALTIAVSTLLSAFNSLTLSPALCALLLQSHDARKDWFGRLWDRLLGGFFAAFNRGFERTAGGYARSVDWWVRRSALGLVTYAVLLGAAFVGFRTVPTGFIPAQDKGYLIVSIQLPDGASLARTDEVVRRASDIILDTPGVVHAVAFAGFSGASRATSPNAGAIFITPESFDERAAHGPSAPELLATLQKRLSQIREAQIFVIPPPPVQGLGTSGGYKLMVQDRRGRGLRALQQGTEALVQAANRDPGLNAVFSTFRASAPQLHADVDRVKAKKLDVPLGNVFDTLEVYLGSVYVNDFNAFGRTFQVRAQAEGRFRSKAEDIERLYTRNVSGDMVPLGSIVDVEWRSGPDRVVHYNMFPAADVDGNTAPGTSLGTAMETIERLAGRVLPAGLAIEWTDLAYQAKLAGNTALFIFPLCVLFVFLVHSAEYESWSLPLAIILIAPMCLPFALLGVWLRGIEDDLITQIGFVVLIGLAAKNAVLIVEFAKQQEEKGKDRFGAAVEACRLRLRPILMTSFAFILGVVPLATARGAGAEMRRTLGTAVFSGMLGVTLFGLFLTPVFFVVLRGLLSRRTEHPGGGTGGGGAERRDGARDGLGVQGADDGIDGGRDGVASHRGGEVGDGGDAGHGRGAVGAGGNGRGGHGAAQGLGGRRAGSTMALVLVAASLAALSSQGCMLAGRDYRPPDVEVPASFADATVDTPEATVAAAWWESFEDGTLSSLMERAVRGNDDLQIAAARVREARALRFEQALDLAPVVTADAGYTRTRLSEDRLGLSTGGVVAATAIDRDLALYDTGFDATWELDLFGRVRRSVEARSAEVQAAEETLRDVLVSLQGEVARNYFELRGNQQRLMVAERNAENQKATLELTQALLSGGRGTDFDTSRARAQLTTTLATIPPLQSAIKRSEHRLAVLLGLPPETLEQELALEEGLPELPPLADVGDPAALLRRRPDVRAAERELAAATARHGVAVADLFPRVTFIGSFALESSDLTGLGSSGSDSYSFGPRLSWAAFDLARVRARIEATDARTDAALASYERTVLTALEEAENALVDFSRERARRDHLRVAAQASATAARLARERYQFGVSDFLSVLDAERTLLEAQDRLMESETRTATALVAVYKALGGGWQAGGRTDERGGSNSG